MDGPILSVADEKRIARLAALLTSSKAPEPAPSPEMAAAETPVVETQFAAPEPTKTPEVQVLATPRPTTTARSALERNFAANLKPSSEGLDDEEPLLDLIVRPVTQTATRAKSKAAALFSRAATPPEPDESLEPLTLDPAYFRRQPVRGRRL